MEELMEARQQVQNLEQKLDLQTREGRLMLQDSQELKEDVKRRVAEHQRELDSARRECESKLARQREEYENRLEEAGIAAASSSQQAKASAKECEQELLQAREELEALKTQNQQLAQSAHARNSDFHLQIKTKELEVIQLRSEVKRLEDLQEKSAQVAAGLQLQMAKEREDRNQNHFAHHRQALDEAQKQLTLLSDEVNRLRGEAIEKDELLLAEKTLRQQTLSAQDVERHTLLAEWEKRRAGEARLSAAELEASHRRMQQALDRVGLLERQLETQQLESAHREVPRLYAPSFPILLRDLVLFKGLDLLYMSSGLTPAASGRCRSRMITGCCANA
jgi:hypothetical protein